MTMTAGAAFDLAGEPGPGSGPGWEPVLDLGAVDTPGEVLSFVRGRQAVVRTAEAEMLAAAVAWAHQHPAESIASAAGWDAGCDLRVAVEQAVPIAGAGAPLVAEFAIAELAAVLGMSTVAGKSYLGHALEVHHRLPHTRALVEAGQLAVWRARRVAEHTTGLCEDGAAWVDEQIAPVASRVGPITLDRLVVEALARFESDTAAAQAAAAAEGRHVSIGALGTPGADQPGVVLSGLSRVEAVLDGDDAADLETAIALTAAHLAETQHAGGAEPETLQVRRAQALGIIARDHLTRAGRPPHQHDAHAEPADPERVPVHLASIPADPAPRKTAPSRSPRTTVLHVHLAQDALHHCGCAGTPLVRLEEGHHKILLAEVIRRWLGAALERGEQITVKPVIDLADHHHADAYEIPHRLHQQTLLRDPHCVFPHCTRPARGCDTDHITPYDKHAPPGSSGQTASDNLAPLCRRHHRLKTHARGWTYHALDPGNYLWHSPHGYQFLVDHTGTHEP